MVTRNLRQLVLGIPVIVVAIPAFSAAILISLRSETDAKQYRTALRDAINSDNTVEASLFFRKLKQLESVDDRMVFQQALSLVRSGNANAAYDMMRTIASEETIGHVPAHLWIADAILSKQLAFPKSDLNRLVETHLRLADAGQPGSLAVNRLMARFYLVSKNADRATSILEPLAKNNIPAQLDLAVSYIHQGRLVEGRKIAQEIAQDFAKRIQDGDELEPAAFLLASGSWKILDRPANVIRLLHTGLELHPDNSRLREAFVNNLTEWIKKKPRNASRFLMNHVAVLEHAMEVAPSNPWVLVQLARLSCHPGIAGQKCRTFIESTNPDDLLPEVQTVLAMQALRDEEFDTARRHFQSLHESDETNVVAANNLAWLYANKMPLQLEEALALANECVSSGPDNPKSRNLRGQILVKLRHWTDAIEDLELAVNAMPNQPTIHDALATAYGQLGHEELAISHREAATLIREKRLPFR